MSLQYTDGEDLSDAGKKRHAMVEDSIERLRHFAYRAKHVRGLSNEQAVVVCIQVDSHWRPLVDALMPGEDWQRFRDMGQEPIARGTAFFPICEDIAKLLPDIAESLLEKPEDGRYKCIALDEGGCTVYEIDPIEQQAIQS
ncbi:MAG: hypothetical protein HGA31_02145 [Candidatus Moranbacteria bacterium]|nr:hypothetical protein [Candidatus Moranbacteria bacterium]